MYQKGFGFITLLAVIVIISILGFVGYPLYNGYVGQAKILKGISYIEGYKHQIESCAIEQQNMLDCDLNEFGISPPIQSEKHNIISYDVQDSTINVVFDIENYSNNTYPLNIVFQAIPNFRNTVPEINWDVYCNDFDDENNYIYYLCKDSVENMPEDLLEDIVYWKTEILPWRTISDQENITNWEPVPALQTYNYTQIRGYTLRQERTVITKEKNLNSGVVFNSLEKKENREINETETRNISVVIANWLDQQNTKACSAWSPLQNTVDEGESFIQNRECTIEQRREIAHNYQNTRIHNFFQENEKTFNESRAATGTKVVAGGSGIGVYLGEAYPTESYRCPSSDPHVYMPDFGIGSPMCGAPPVQVYCDPNIYDQGYKTLEAVVPGYLGGSVGMKSGCVRTGRNYVPGHPIGWVVNSGRDTMSTGSCRSGYTKEAKYFMGDTYHCVESVGGRVPTLGRTTVYTCEVFGYFYNGTVVKDGTSCYGIP